MINTKNKCFQLCRVVETSSNKIWVQFFNNDFDKPNHFAIADFKELNNSFNNLFPDIIKDNTSNWKLCSLLGEFNSEKELIEELEKTVKKFLISFYDYFKNN